MKKSKELADKKIADMVSRRPNNMPPSKEELKIKEY